MKGDVLSPALKRRGNEDICPFTLEPADDCNVKNSTAGEALCFFMLETCYFQKRGKLRK